MLTRGNAVWTSALRLLGDNPLKLETINNALRRVGLVLVLYFETDGSKPTELLLMRWSTYLARYNKKP